MFRIGFLQCQIVKELPHMNMPLFVNDIKALGCSFECICVARNKLSDLIEYVKKKKLKKDGLLIECKTDLDHWRFKDKNILRFINDFHNGLGDKTYPRRVYYA